MAVDAGAAAAASRLADDTSALPARGTASHGQRRATRSLVTTSTLGPRRQPPTITTSGSSQLVPLQCAPAAEPARQEAKAAAVPARLRLYSAQRSATRRAEYTAAQEIAHRHAAACDTRTSPWTAGRRPSASSSAGRTFGGSIEPANAPARRARLRRARGMARSAEHGAGNTTAMTGGARPATRTDAWRRFRARAVLAAEPSGDFLARAPLGHATSAASVDHGPGPSSGGGKLRPRADGGGSCRTIIRSPGVQPSTGQ